MMIGKILILKSYCVNKYFGGVQQQDSKIASKMGSNLQNSFDKIVPSIRIATHGEAIKDRI